MAKDVYGNPDPFQLFYDLRAGTNVWYPAVYANHPIWSQYLTAVDGIYLDRPAGMHGGSAYTVPSSLVPTYPGAIFPGATTYPGQSNI